jgi:hypothetical protein
VAWKLTFYTKAPRGGMFISRQPLVKFNGGVLVIKNTDMNAIVRARKTLCNPYRGLDFRLVEAEGQIPAEIQELIGKDTTTEYFQGLEELKRKKEDIEPEVSPLAAEGIEVVEAQPEMPTGDLAEVIEDGAAEAPDSIVITNLPDDLFLADRVELERFAKEHCSIQSPEDYRNDDLLINDIMGYLEKTGQVSTESSEEKPVPEPEPSVEAEPVLPEWTLATPPEQYLKRWPKGKNADLARQYIAAGQ